MKPETLQQMSVTIEAFKPLNAYLERMQKTNEAFLALETKVKKAEEDHKNALRAAGDLEAKRLLGETTSKESKALDVSLTEMRDQQDRLQAAASALDLQKKELESEVRKYSDAASNALAQMEQAILTELNEELTQAARQITSVVNRLFAFYEGARLHRRYGRNVFEMNIPSLLNDENLFKQPIRLHPRDGDIVQASWCNDPAAVQIKDDMTPLGNTYRQLQRLERDVDGLPIGHARAF